MTTKRMLWELTLLSSLAACSADPSEATRATPVLAWGFEPASADCNGWPVLGADAIRAAPARSGAYACKVCSNGSGDIALAHDLGAMPEGRYMLTAWVRSRRENASPPVATAWIDATAGGVPVRTSAPQVDIREAWDRLDVALGLERGASSLRIAVGASAPEASLCLLVDDVLLLRR